MRGSRPEGPGSDLVRVRVRIRVRVRDRVRVRVRGAWVGPGRRLLGVGLVRLVARDGERLAGARLVVCEDLGLAFGLGFGFGLGLGLGVANLAVCEHRHRVALQRILQQCLRAHG